MRAFFKLCFIGVVGLAVFLATAVEMDFMRSIPGLFDFAAYIRIASLLLLLIAMFLALGYMKKIQASQKYSRAKEMLAEAEETSKRKQTAAMELEERLKATYAEKEKGLDREVEQLKKQCREELRDLKQQNIALKESVSKLMAIVKKRTNGKTA